MKFVPFIVKVLGREDQYLSRNMGITDRHHAYVNSYMKSVLRAQKHFGPDWPDKAQVVEIPIAEYMARLAGKNSEARTEARQKNIKRLNAKRYGARKFYVGEIEGKEVCICGHSRVEAAKIAEQAGLGKIYWMIYRKFKAVRQHPDNQPLELGVWQKNKDKWKKLL